MHVDLALKCLSIVFVFVRTGNGEEQLSQTCSVANDQCESQDDAILPTCEFKYDSYQPWDGLLNFGVPIHIFFAGPGDCANARETFHVDSRISDIYLMMESAGPETPKLSVFDDSGETVDIGKPIASNNQSQIAHSVRSHQTGRWSARLSANQHACIFLVHATTDMTINMGLVEESRVNSDAPLTPGSEMVMVPKKKYFFIIKANDLKHPGGVDRLEIRERSESTFKLIGQYVPGKRQNCVHDLYFGPVSCSNVGNVYYFTIIGKDERGAKFERSQTVRCLAEKKTE